MLPPSPLFQIEEQVKCSNGPTVLGLTSQTNKSQKSGKLKHRNTGLVSSRVILTSWGEDASLALVGALLMMVS